MKKWVMVLAFCGVMVSSAGAGERWPANVCKDIGSLRAIIEKHYAAVDRGTARFATLMLQREHCGVDITAALGADRAPIPARREARPAAEPRQPLLCDTTPKANGGSYIDCF